MKVGIELSWRPGNSLPPKSTLRAIKSVERETFRLTEALFADDTTLYGEKDEMVHGKEIVNSSMTNFEEQCHDGKEEHLALGTQEGEATRMLGTWVGRRQDLEKSKKRGRCAVMTIKKRLKSSRLTKTTQALIIQAVVN